MESSNSLCSTRNEYSFEVDEDEADELAENPALAEAPKVLGFQHQ